VFLMVEDVNEKDAVRNPILCPGRPIFEKETPRDLDLVGRDKCRRMADSSHFHASCSLSAGDHLRDRFPRQQIRMLASHDQHRMPDCSECFPQKRLAQCGGLIVGGRERHGDLRVVSKDPAAIAFMQQRRVDRAPFFARQRPE
jgi:hypothetical protein